MKNKNKFKIFHPFLNILFLCFGIFYSVNSFAYVIPKQLPSEALISCQAFERSPYFCYSFPPVASSQYSVCYTAIVTSYEFCAISALKTCPPPQTLDIDTYTCIIPPVPVCISPQTLDTVTNTCVFPPEFLCSSGSMSIFGICPQQITCLDGSQHSAPFDCSTLTKICQSGLIVSKDQSCDQPTKQCPDGSFVSTTSFCPSLITITCDDGSLVPYGSACPTPNPSSLPSPDPISSPSSSNSLAPLLSSSSPSSVSNLGGSIDLSAPTKAPLNSPASSSISFGSGGSLVQPIVSDPCANGGCETIDLTMPQDYAREGTLQRNVDINFEMGKLMEDIRFKELSSMVHFLNDSSNSLDVIQQYQKTNIDHFIALQKELGLQHLDDNSFHDLMVKGGDISRKYLYDIYKQINWSDNEKLKKQDKSIKFSKSILQTNNKILASSKQFNKDSNTNAKDLLKVTKDTNSILSNALKDDGIPLNVGSVVADFGTSTGDFSGLTSMGTDVQSIKNGVNTKLSDTSELDKLDTILNIIIPGVSSLYTVLPSLSCAGNFSQVLNIQGKSIAFTMDVCSRLADLKLALAWIFGFYAMRTAFNNIFAPKGI